MNIETQNTHINVYSLNTARSNKICHTALHIASKHTRNFNLILFQEPWFGPITSSGDTQGGCSQRGWIPLLPTYRSIPEDHRPRVMAYYRQSSLIEVTPCTDIIDDLDIQIIDVKR